MLYANDFYKNKILAKPKIKGLCPFCNEELISRCGEINIWHWSHKSIIDCDSWAYGETEWHLKWKSLVKPEFCEVGIKNHRADIIGNDEKIIELQNSPITPKEIKEREEFYNNMIWLINVPRALEIIYNSFYISEKIILRKKDNYWTFRWKNPKKSFWKCIKPLFFDLGDENILCVKKLYNNIPCNGWGYLIKKDVFIKRYLSNVLKDG